MALDNVKDQFKDQGQAIWNRIRESSAFNQVLEKIQDQPPGTQKLILYGLGFIAALFMFSIPYFFYSSSQDTLTQFEVKKDMIRDAYRVSRAASAVPATNISVSTAELRAAVQSALGMVNPSLMPVQTVSILDFDNAKAPDTGLPKTLTQQGLIVNLTKLNLDQVVKIGAQLNNLRPSAKMIGVRIQAMAPDPHYFDATFKIVAFNLPAEPPSKANSKSGGAKPSGKDKGGD